jgi:hypothetical protein
MIGLTATRCGAYAVQRADDWLHRPWQRPQTILEHEQDWNARACHADIVLPAPAILEAIAPMALPDCPPHPGWLPPVTTFPPPSFVGRGRGPQG